MDDTYEKAVSRAVRLLRLAQSENPNEAAAAAAKAQEIIDRYKLGSLGLSWETEVERDAKGNQEAPDEPIRDLGVAPLDEARDTWRVRLSSSLAKANSCRIYLRGEGGIALVGRPSDAEVIRYLYAVLVQDVQRLADRDGAGLGRTWRNNYRIGVVETLGMRLRTQRQEMEAALKAEALAHVAIPQERALARVAQALVRLEKRSASVETWMESNMKLRTVSGSRSRYSSGAREAGRKAGHEINLGRRRAGALGSGQ